MAFIADFNHFTGDIQTILRRHFTKYLHLVIKNQERDDENLAYARFEGFIRCENENKIQNHELAIKILNIF